MLVHADLGERVVVDTRKTAWVLSPEPGVERIMLERDGDETARATSIVRYAPGSGFAAHEHARGEEFLVLDGEFRDEHGVYPAGTYVRNPWGSRHAPFSLAGCTLFVKLRQMPEGERQRARVHNAVARSDLERGRAGREVVLYASDTERVSLMRWDAGHAAARHQYRGVAEVLVLEGRFEDEHGCYPARTWIRQPAGSAHQACTREGCLLFLKQGLR